MPGTFFAVLLRILGVILMMAWLAAAFFDVGPEVVRPGFLVAGACLSWWAMRDSPS